MCGLAGTARTSGAPLTEEADGLLRRMSHAVAHRGPDGERFLREGPVGLAFRRLALVAPDSGDQPLSNTDGSIVLIANGEVYNHRDLEAGLPAGTRLRTKSDCEVLVHLYERDGLRFLDQVLGMYALILWDRRRNLLLFARDRFGIKPLYYTHNGEHLTFASEIKALFEDPRCPRELDWETALADQTTAGAVALSHDPLVSWFRGVEFVPAGTIVTFDLATGRSQRHVYWPLPSFDGDSDASDEEFVRRYRELLDVSVADCASADAEVGLFLSGGVDSSAVAALAAPRTSLHTFTALTGSTLASGDAQAAHRTAAALGLPNHQVLFDAQRVPHVDEWKRLLWLLETPLCGPEQYYKYELYRFVKQVRPGLKGMLLGQAADEFNGGYSVLLSGGAGWDGYTATLERLHREHALRRDPRLAPWDGHHTRALLRRQALPAATHDEPFQAFVAWKYRDIQQYNCWHEDRTAAGNGVEARVPFLDHRIVELMATVPAARRERLLWDKWILREAVRDLLPPEASERHKVSFYHGEGEQFTHRLFVRMLAQDGCALVEEALAAPTAAELVEAGAVRDMLDGLRASRSPRGVEHLLPLVNLGLLERMLADLPCHPIDAPARVLAPALPITDWEREAPLVAAGMLTDGERLTGTELVELGDGVEVARSWEDEHVSYVAVDGRFEFVVDDRDGPWARILGALAPGRPLADVLEAAGVRLADVEGDLHEALDTGVLVSRGRVPATDAEQAVRPGVLAR